MSTQYCACCVDDEEIFFYGLGETPDEAYNDFMQKGDFDNQCDDFIAKSGEEIEVYIYSTSDPEDSDWPEEECDPDWAFVLDKKIETRVANAP